MKREDAKKQQNLFKSNINQLIKGKSVLKEQKSAIENIKLLYKSREAVIKLFNDYSSIAFEAKYKAKHRDGLKILTPTQMLQRLPIALSQVNELTN